MIVRISENKKRERWNACAAHPMQSWEWGEARTAMGLQVVRLLETINDTHTNVYQMTVHPIPHTPYSIGYIPRSVNPSPEVLSFLTDYGKKHNIVYVKFEPNQEASTKDALPKNLVQSRTPLFPAWTQVLNLTPSEDDLLKNMKPKTRYNIRLAQKKGVTVQEMTNDEGFEIFYNLYEETCKRQHYFGHNYSYHKTIFNTLKDSISHILVASYMGKPLAAYHLFLFNETLYYPYGASSTEHKEVMAPNLIMWESILFGKKNKAKSYDLWGSLSPKFDTENIWAGFTRFKEGYGTTYVEKVGSYDLIIKPLLYHPLVTAQKIRERLMSA